MTDNANTSALTINTVSTLIAWLNQFVNIVRDQHACRILNTWNSFVIVFLSIS